MLPFFLHEGGRAGQWGCFARASASVVWAPLEAGQVAGQQMVVVVVWCRGGPCSKDHRVMGQPWVLCRPVLSMMTPPGVPPLSPYAPKKHKQQEPTCLVVVQVGVEHDDREGQDVGGVGRPEPHSGHLLVIPRAKGLQLAEGVGMRSQ